MSHPYGRAFSPAPNDDHQYPARRATSARPTARPLPVPRQSVKRAVSENLLDQTTPEKPTLRRPQTTTSGYHSKQDSQDIDAMTMLATRHRKHYVRQEGDVTLVLSGHSGMGDLPVYNGGSLVRGLVTLTRTENISSVVVNLEGSVRVRDLQGGDGASYFLSETLFSWDGKGTAPHEFNFETLLGSFIPPVHERRVLPPTFSARFSNILHGFSVSVRYEFVISVTRSTGPLEFWKKRARLRVPFTFKPLTRPSAPGPFSSRPTRGGSLHPQTVFIDSVRPREVGATPIESHIFLPAGQIIPTAERISFRISLRAPDVVLAPLLHGTPILPSFLPLGAPLLCTSASGSSHSLGSVNKTRPSIMARMLEASTGRTPVSVRLERQVILDARGVGGGFSGSGVGWVRGRRIASTEILAEGQLQRAKATDGRVRWWGAVDVPASAACPGFAAGRLIVQDFLVITIDMPGMQTHELPFRQAIPIRLTSHSARAVSAVQLADPEVF